MYAIPYRPAVLTAVQARADALKTATSRMDSHVQLLQNLVQPAEDLVNYAAVP